MKTKNTRSLLAICALALPLFAMSPAAQAQEEQQVPLTQGYVPVSVETIEVFKLMCLVGGADLNQESQKACTSIEQIEARQTSQVDYFVGKATWHQHASEPKAEAMANAVDKAHTQGFDNCTFESQWYRNTNVAPEFVRRITIISEVGELFVRIKCVK